MFKNSRHCVPASTPAPSPSSQPFPIEVHDSKVIHGTQPSRLSNISLPAESRTTGLACQSPRATFDRRDILRGPFRRRFSPRGGNLRATSAGFSRIRSGAGVNGPARRGDLRAIIGQANPATARVWKRRAFPERASFNLKGTKVNGRYSLNLNK